VGVGIQEARGEPARDVVGIDLASGISGLVVIGSGSKRF
jgi:hypothetical protein